MSKTNENSDLSPEVSAYMSRLGKRGGDSVKEKYGMDYYKKIAAKRKSFGRQKVEPEVETEA